MQTTDHDVVRNRACLGTGKTISGIPDRTVGVDFPLWRRNLQAAATRWGRGRKPRRALFNQAGSPLRTRRPRWAFRRAPSVLSASGNSRARAEKEAAWLVKLAPMAVGRGIDNLKGRRYSSQ